MGVHFLGCSTIKFLVFPKDQACLGTLPKKQEQGTLPKDQAFFMLIFEIT
jgi:hypothetical protein